MFHPRLILLYLVGNPILLVLIFLVPSAILFRGAAQRGRWVDASSRGHWLLDGLSVAMILYYLALCAAYLFSHAFSDHIEPDLATLSWLFWKGQPVYHDMVQPQRYSLMYGPSLFMMVGTSQGMLGPSIFSTKLPGAVASVTALFFMFLIVRRESSFRRALYLTGLAATVLMALFANIIFWSRSDPIILLMVTLGLFATTRKGLLGPLLLGVSAGIAENLKIHACVYFLPALFLAVRQKWGIPRLLVCAAAGIIAAALPFVVFPNVSLRNYVWMLKLAAGQGLSFRLFYMSLEWLAMLALPVALVFFFGIFCTGKEDRRLLSREGSLFAVTLFAACVVMVPASKVGSGAGHLMSFVPALLLIGARFRGLGPESRGLSGPAAGILYTIALAWLGACLVGAVTRGWFEVGNVVRIQEAFAKQHLNDIREIARNHPGKVILSGLGSDDVYPATFSRCELIFEGMPPGIDPAAMMDFRKGGYGQVDLTRLTAYLETQYREPVIWIIPKGSVPFSMPDWFALYAPVNPRFETLLPQSFIDDFSKMYTRTESTACYDIYTPVNTSGR